MSIRTPPLPRRDPAETGAPSGVVGLVAAHSDDPSNIGPEHMTSENGHRYLMVRVTARPEEDLAVFFEKGVVAVGWSRVSFRVSDDPQILAREVKDVYYPPGGTAPQVVSKKLNEVIRFKRIRPGDRIVVPIHNAIALAVAGEEEIHDAEAGTTHDLANQRRAEFFRSKGQLVAISRSKLSEALQRRLRVRGSTVADLSEFGSEIEGLFDTENVGWQLQFEKAENAAASAFKRDLLRNIQSGTTNLEAGGVGLERLVRELLTIEGYTARVLGKQSFRGWGDADIVATKSDKFNETSLLVQVKHHTGETGPFGAEQLLAIIRNQSEQYAEHHLVLVTTALASEELRNLCASQDITLIAGSDLIDWIYELQPELPSDVRIKLGITDVPVIAF